MPDLNSLPPSPYRPQAPTATTQRRPSHARRLSDHPVPITSTTTPPLHSPKPQEENDRDVDLGPGPLRHPRPLTAAELYSRQELENEAIVNRLTRELTLLRQQTASAVSNASSASISTGIADGTAQTESVYLNNSIHPTSARRHRSSSNLSSSRSSIGGTGPASIASSTAATVGSTSTSTGPSGSAIAPPRETSYSHNRTGGGGSVGLGPGGEPLSRQSSITSRRSDATSPSLVQTTALPSSGFDPYFPHHQYHHHHHPHGRHSHSNSLSAPSPARGIPQAQISGQHIVPGTLRYDETAQAKAELEMVKNENEALKARIRELEQAARRSSTSSATGRAQDKEK